MSERQLVAGRYRLVTPLGSRTWTADDEQRHRDVVVELDLAPQVAERIRAVSHPGLPGRLATGTTDRTAYLVSELVTAPGLRDAPQPPGQWAGQRVLDLVGQLGFALAALHDAGVAHGSVDPDHVRVRADGVVLLVGGGSSGASAVDDIRALGRLGLEQLAPGAAPAEHFLVEISTAAPPVDAAEVARRALALARRPDPGPPVSPPAAAAAAAAATSGAAGSAGADRSRSQPADPPAREDERRRVRNRMIAVGAVVVLAGLVLLRVFGGHGATARVPTLVGSRYADAVVALHRVGLVARQRQQPSGRPAGTVIAQSAAPGARVRAGSTVTVTVATAGTVPAVTPGGSGGG